MENKKDKRVVFFALGLILVAYFVMEKLTHNYLPPISLSEKKCDQIDGDLHPEELKNCLEAMIKYDMDTNAKPSAKYLSTPDFDMSFKMYVEGVPTEELNATKQDDKLFIYRKDSYKLVLCSSNLASYMVSGTFIQITPNLDKPYIVCLDKDSKKIINFSSSKISEESVKEMTQAMQALKDQDVSNFQEFK